MVKVRSEVRPEPSIAVCGGKGSRNGVMAFRMEGINKQRPTGK